jgi:Na+/melibiose symporter-like transporter
MVTMRSLRSFASAVFAVGVVLVAAAAPAGAQQLVDAGGDNGQGGLAFVLMALMVFVIGFALFFMDRVRRRAADDDRVDR